MASLRCRRKVKPLMTLINTNSSFKEAWVTAEKIETRDRAGKLRSARCTGGEGGMLRLAEPRSAGARLYEPQQLRQ